MKVIVSSLLLICVAVPAWARWEKEWNKVLAAGRKEGKVVIRASSDAEFSRPNSRQALASQSSTLPAAGVR